MAKATLPTNYQDDVLKSTMGGKRRYTMTDNSDGTKTLEDATQYEKVGSNFGAADINKTNTAVNAAADASKIIDNVNDIKANTQAGYMMGALAGKQLIHDLGDMTGITNNTYNTVAKLLQHYIDSGYLPDVNSVALVPILSGANSRILTNGDNSSYPAWYAYDNNVSTKFIPSAGASRYIGFDFQAAVLVKRIEWRGADSAYPGFSDQAKLQASADGTNWVVIKNLVGGSTYGQDMFVNATGATKYRYWRVLDNIRFGLFYLQFYGRQ